MKGREFMNSVANGKTDILELVLRMLEGAGGRYCVIGGLAVNAYTEPVVSLDLDIVVAAEHLKDLWEAAQSNGLKVERFEHSVNLSSADSDLRVQLQTDARYQAFIARAEPRDLLGYQMKVASLEDTLQGKIWACLDDTRRKSKRHKDLADIMRLVEAHPQLEANLPVEILDKLR